MMKPMRRVKEILKENSKVNLTVGEKNLNFNKNFEIKSKCRALIDSGASCSLIHKRIFESLKKSSKIK